MIRRFVSMALPGAESEIILTGLVGKLCASACGAPPIKAAPSTNDANRMDTGTCRVMASCQSTLGEVGGVRSAPLGVCPPRGGFGRSRSTQAFEMPPYFELLCL